MIDDKRKEKDKKLRHMHIDVCYAKMFMGKPLNRVRWLKTRFLVINCFFAPLLMLSQCGSTVAGARLGS